MELQTVWTGTHGWLIPGLPQRGHLVAKSDTILPPPPLPKVTVVSRAPGEELTRDRILRHLTDGGPLTCLELSRRMRAPLTTVQTVVSQLRRFGRVEKSGYNTPVRLV